MKILRLFLIILILPYHSSHHCCNIEMFLRIYWLVLFICRLEVHLLAIFAEVLHRPAAIYMSDDDVARLGCPATLDEYQIALLNTGIYHRVALDPKQIGDVLVIKKGFADIHG